MLTYRNLSDSFMNFIIYIWEVSRPFLSCPFWLATVASDVKQGPNRDNNYYKFSNDVINNDVIKLHCPQKFTNIGLIRKRGKKED